MSTQTSTCLLNKQLAILHKILHTFTYARYHLHIHMDSRVDTHTQAHTHAGELLTHSCLRNPILTHSIPVIPRCNHMCTVGDMFPFPFRLNFSLLFQTKSLSRNFKLHLYFLLLDTSWVSERWWVISDIITVLKHLQGIRKKQTVLTEFFAYLTCAILA